MSKGYKMVTDGTENHLVLWDLRPLGLTGMLMWNCDCVLSVRLVKSNIAHHICRNDQKQMTPSKSRTQCK